MPKKLISCVEKLKRQGKPEKQAWPICITTTGLRPHKKKKKDKKKMKKADTFVNNLISRPLDLDQHIRSTLDPNALKFITLLRYYTRDLDLNDPITIPVNDYSVNIHKVEPGIYSGNLLDQAKNIIMEFKQQSLPIIGSMLAAKLENIVLPQESEDRLENNEENESENNKGKVNINIKPDGEVNISIQKSKESKMSKLLDKLHDELVKSKPVEEKPIKKSRLQRMWKIFNIDMPETLDSIDNVIKACDGTLKLSDKILSQDKTEPEASFISMTTVKEKYGQDEFDKIIKGLEVMNTFEKGYMGFKRVEEAARRGGAEDPAAVAAAVGRKKYGPARYAQMIAAGKPGGKKGKPAPAKMKKSPDFNQIFNAVSSNKMPLDEALKQLPKEQQDDLLRKLRAKKSVQKCKYMKKSTIIDSLTPDESIQPNTIDEMYELRKQDAEARWNITKYDEEQTKKNKGIIRKSSNLNQDIEKIEKSRNNTHFVSDKKYKEFSSDEMKKANLPEPTDTEKDQQSKIDHNWNRHPQKNYFENDDKSNADKYFDKK